MGVTNYYSVGGEILGESTGAVRTDYLRDALGSVTGTVDASGTPQRSYSYKPYGSELASSGTGSDPRFRWVGSRGYRDMGLAHASHYVRMRDYASEEGRWNSVDPFLTEVLKGSTISPSAFLGLQINLFRYVRCRTTTLWDPFGWIEEGGGGEGPPVEVGSKACVEVVLPLPIGGEKLEIFAKACISCFKPPCKCGGGVNTCLELIVGGSLRIGGPSLKDFLEIEHLKEDLEILYTFASKLIGGLLSGGLCLVPLDDCKRPEDDVNLEVCLSACLVAGTAEGCITWPPLDKRFEFSGGICGLPSLAVELKARRYRCPAF